MTVREYTPSDIPLFRRFAPDEWSGAHETVAHSLTRRNPTERCFVAETDGGLAGYAYGFVLPNGTLFIDFVYVTPRYRGSGVASALLRGLETASGCREALVFFHKSLRGFYTCQGYETGTDLDAAVKLL